MKCRRRKANLVDRGVQMSENPGVFSNAKLPAHVWIPAALLLSTVSIYLHLKASYFDQKSTAKNNSTNTDDHCSSVDNLKLHYYDWIPMKPAGIYDRVDHSNYPYNILKSIKPKILMLEDREIVPMELKPLKKLKSSVRVFVVDDLLSDEECNMLRVVHHKRVLSMSEHDPIICFGTLETLEHHLTELGHAMKVSRKFFIQGTRCLNASFSAKMREWGMVWSHGTGFYINESSFSLDISKRIEDVVGFNEENGGAFRIVSYLPHTGYKLHTDCSLSGFKGKEDRFGSVLIYLDDVQIGGHTYFPELGIHVKPKKGRGLIWNNMTPSGICDPTSLHAADIVIKGHKYILQRWYYYQNFPGIERRPPVPPKPRRHKNQANVECDEYKNGSCRWYDTWTYDILTHF